MVSFVRRVWFAIDVCDEMFVVGGMFVMGFAVLYPSSTHMDSSNPPRRMGRAAGETHHPCSAKIQIANPCTRPALWIYPPAHKTMK